MKKIFIFILSCNFMFGADANSGNQLLIYGETLAIVKNTTDMVTYATQQIRSLGGVKTAVSDMKRTIYNARDDMRSAMNSLDNSLKELDSVVSDEDLFNLNTDNSYYGEGVFTEDINKFINNVVGNINEATKEETKRLKYINNRLVKINKALYQRSSTGFVTGMKEALYNEKNKLLKEKKEIDDRNKKVANNTRAFIATTILKNTYKEYSANPDNLSRKRKNAKDLRKLAENIPNKSTMVAQQQITNLLLVEMLKKLMVLEKHTSAYQTAILMSQNLHKANSK